MYILYLYSFNHFPSPFLGWHPYFTEWDISCPWPSGLNFSVLSTTAWILVKHVFSILLFLWTYASLGLWFTCLRLSLVKAPPPKSQLQGRDLYETSQPHPRIVSHFFPPLSYQDTNLIPPLYHWICNNSIHIFMLSYWELSEIRILFVVFPGLNTAHYVECL
jgi:hypothetical protein